MSAPPFRSSRGCGEILFFCGPNRPILVARVLPPLVLQHDRMHLIFKS